MSPTRRAADPTRPRLGALALPELILAIAVCVVPIVTLLVFSFGRSSVVTLDVEISGTIDAYRRLFSDVYRPVIFRSLALAATAVGLCVVLGTPAALAISRLPVDRQRRAVLLVMFPSFVSFTVRIFAWQGILATGGPVDGVTGQVWLYRPPAVLIGMATAYLPLYILPVVAALTRLSPSVLDAAADLGASVWTQTRTVVFPLAMPGLVTGAAIVGVLGVGEFIVPNVLGGGKVLLLGGVLSQRGAGSDRPLGGVIIALMLAMFIVAGTLVLAVRRRAARHGY